MVQGGLACRTEFRNNVDGHIITNIATQYYYDDGTTSLDSVRTNIAKGQNGYTFSRDDTSCVKHTSNAVVVDDQNAYTDTVPDPGANECWTTCPVQELNPAFTRKKTPAHGEVVGNVELYAIDPKTGSPIKHNIKVFKSLEEALAEFKKTAKEK